MFDGPHTDADGHDGDEDKRDEDQQPQDLWPAVLQLVTGQQLKHEQQHVHASAQHHALVVRVRLTLQPAAQKFTLLIDNFKYPNIRIIAINQLYYLFNIFTRISMYT